ncbi:hypothetical protein GCM10009665_44790 [Kitasatospora nipponensis]|uniref:RNA polymerase sigma-70 factor (ECF subfamily) n=2 Tax=Kitasatospora nipponensis TaxID=258049 RepID=A0ABN1WJM1_9ACTN
MYVEHHRAVRRYVQRRAPAGDVPDITAEVFAIAWQKFEAIPAGAVLPWLYAVARNTIANEHRGAARAARLAAAVADLSEQGTRDVGDQVAARHAVYQAWSALRADDRELLALIGWEGLSVRDAARALGCSAAACSVRLLRARGRLRRALDAAQIPAGQHRTKTKTKTMGVTS